MFIISGDHTKNLNIDVSKTSLYFYDFTNNINFTFPLHQAADGLSNNYNLDVSKKLIFFVPGYKSHISKKTEDLIRQTFRDVPDIYLIIIDHSAYTSAKGGTKKSYERSVTHSYYIGKSIGEFFAQLKQKGFPAKNIHAIGHSLGAQILGYAGEEFMNKTGDKIWKITGLDPAGPCFGHSFINEQLRSGLADYVEVYHCNAGGLGTKSVLADIDFFFNDNGEKQPSCNGGIIPFRSETNSMKCNHKACLRFWTFTVHRKDAFLAWNCFSYKAFMDGRCAANEVTIAGYWNPGNATGVFYATTGGYGFE